MCIQYSFAGEIRPNSNVDGMLKLEILSHFTGKDSGTRFVKFQERKKLPLKAMGAMLGQKRQLIKLLLLKLYLKRVTQANTCRIIFCGPLIYCGSKYINMITKSWMICQTCMIKNNWCQKYNYSSNSYTIVSMDKSKGYILDNW